MHRSPYFLIQLCVLLWGSTAILGNSKHPYLMTIDHNYVAA